MHCPRDGKAAEDIGRVMSVSAEDPMTFRVHLGTFQRSRYAVKQ